MPPENVRLFSIFHRKYSIFIKKQTNKQTNNNKKKKKKKKLNKSYNFIEDILNFSMIQLVPLGEGGLTGTKVR